MRKLLVSLAAAAVLIGVAPVVTHAMSGTSVASPQRLATDLAASIDAATPGESFLVFVHGLTPAAARRGVEAAGLTNVGEFRSVGVPVAVGTASQVRVLADLPGITYVEPNREVKPLLETARQATRADEASEATFPTDCQTTTTGGEGKKRKGATTTTTCTDVGPFDGTGQTIAIVDGGVDGTHPMFVDSATGVSKVVRNLKVACLNNTPVYFPNLAGQGQFPPDTCPKGDAAEPFLVDFTALNDTDTMSAGGHGTHVAGVAAGVEVTTDGRTFSGVATGSKVVSISTGAAIGIYGANAALDWIVRHHEDPCGTGDPVACPPITVINNSYGGAGEFDSRSVTSQLQDALLGEDIVVVWANGNGDDTDVDGDRGGTGTDNRSGIDAQHPGAGVISVANYDDGGTGTRNGVLNVSSSRGESARAETWPDLSAPGTDITSACRPYLLVCASGDSDPDYGTIGGTSMAAPHVAGVVAILRQANPALTAADVEDILQDTAHKFTFGAEYVADPQNQGGTSSFDKGAGLVDAVNALRVALGLDPTDPPRGDGDEVPACAPDAPLVTDPEGDATAFAFLDTGENEPTLDVTTVDVLADAVAEELAIVIGIADLTEANPDGTTGISFEGTIGIDGDSYDIDADRAASGETFGFDGTAVAGSFDPTADTVTVVVPRELLDGRAGQVTVKSLSAGLSRHSYDPTPIGPVADSFAGTCPQTVDVGGTIPTDPSSCEPGEAEGCITTALAHEWEGDPSVDAYVASDCVRGDNPVCDTERINVVVPSAGARLRVVLATGDPVANDFDLYVYGPDGAEVGTKASARGDEVLEIAVTESGVYTVAVSAFFAPGATFTGHASLV